MNKLYKYPDKGILGGVCAGLADAYKWDVSVIRIAAVALMFSPVPVITLYVVAWFILPKKDELENTEPQVLVE